MTAPATNGSKNGHRAAEPPLPSDTDTKVQTWSDQLLLTPSPTDSAEALARLQARAEERRRKRGVDPRAEDRRGELSHWWHTTAEQDLAMLLPKAAEYSAHDLRMTGHVLADMMGIEVDDAFAAELACATYLMSKVTRILGAYKEGRLPSMDSIVDARVYATMMARIRERGGWPGWESAI